MITAEIRKRSWRVQQLQDWADDMLALRAARKVLYAGQMGEGRTLKVNNAAEEKQAIAKGFSELATPIRRDPMQDCPRSPHIRRSETPVIHIRADMLGRDQGSAATARWHR